jgi:hypothetical protein
MALHVPLRLYAEYKELQNISKQLLIKKIDIVEKTLDLCEAMEQATKYKYKFSERLDPDPNYIKDLIKLRLLKLKQGQ